MKIRTPGQLDQFLSRTLSWRKKELTALKFAVDTAPRPEQRVLLRAAATLLYSHWEGFVKEAATAYLQLVSRQNLTLGELKSSFVALSIGPQIARCGRSNKVSLRKRLVERIQTGHAAPAKMPWRSMVRTRSNLKAAVLEEIIATLDLDFVPFQLKAKPVIDKLVGARNRIAHGAGMEVDESEYSTLHAEIIGLLEEFKTQIQNAATVGKYRI